MKKNVVSPFIEMIWEIVSDPLSDHIIRWSPNGTSFCITSPSAFAEEILTTSFKHGNISSFVRQLNMYNFHKNKANAKDLEFFHKLFRRDARSLLLGIKRKPSQNDQREGDLMLKNFLLGQDQYQISSMPHKCEASEASDTQGKEESASLVSEPFCISPFMMSFCPTRSTAEKTDKKSTLNFPIDYAHDFCAISLWKTKSESEGRCTGPRLVPNIILVTPSQ